MSAEFYKWFTANAAPTDGFVLSGTWSFNDILTGFVSGVCNFMLADGTECFVVGASAANDVVDGLVYFAVLDGSVVDICVYNSDGWVDELYNPSHLLLRRKYVLNSMSGLARML